MVGIVIVAHSAKLAEGVKELADQMSQGRVPIAAAGGLDDSTIGTNVERILKAIDAVYQPDGVLVLMDLGSAVLSTKMAIQMLPPERQSKVLMSEAPIVEGAIAAAVEASIGSPLERVEAAARGVVTMPKVADALPMAPLEAVGAPPEEVSPVSEITLTLFNEMGLHARPAALFVQVASKFQSNVQVRNLTRGGHAVNAKSMFGVLSLGAEKGHQITISASGPDAEEALATLRQLVESGFREMEQPLMAPVRAPAAPVPQVLKVKPQAPLVKGGVMRKLQGIPASKGIAIGMAYIYRPQALRVEQRMVGDPKAEWDRFKAAVEQAKVEIAAIRERAIAEVGAREAEIFTAHELFLEDPFLLDQVRSLIEDKHLNAEAALSEVVNGYVELLQGMEGEIFRQRAADVEDVGQRVLRILLGESKTPLAELSEPVVLIAHDLTPSDTARLDKKLILGFCTAVGGLSSHTAILARGLGLPAVVGLGDDVLSISNGTPLIIDGEAGLLIVNPDEDTLAAYQNRREKVATREVALKLAAQELAHTRDGYRVEVVANIGDVDSAKIALEYGAEGVGLLRTEFLFLNRTAMPSEEEQYEAYRAIAELMGQRPLIIRTLDIGGDKQLPYLDIVEELNPFLGWRAIRLCLEKTDLFKVQLRAILRAGYGHNVKVMFPMIADVGEVRRAKAILAEVKGELEALGIPFASEVEVGIMVEVPAAAVAADILVQEVDFFSIGTNDLIQYTMACDRTNERVSYLYEPLHPAILRLIKGVIDAAHKAGKWVGMCGEMAGDILAIPILLGLGLDEFSMNPAAIPEAKAIISSLSLVEAKRIAVKALSLSSAEEIKAYVKEVLGIPGKS
jgi:phosphoenolpyruvate-protein phosphotransferase/dihydroxyacetone kinase phosphotransfer subunit